MTSAHWYVTLYQGSRTRQPAYPSEGDIALEGGLTRYELCHCRPTGAARPLPLKPPHMEQMHFHVSRGPDLHVMGVLERYGCGLTKLFPKN